MPQGFHSFLGAATRVHLRNDGVEIEAGGPRLRVSAVAEGVFQVRFSQTGKPLREPPFSYAVVPGYLDGPRPPAEVEDGDAVRIRTSEGIAVIEKDPVRIRFEDSEGNPFAEDDRHGISWRGDRVHVWKRKTEGETFYGLGEKALSLNRTGRRFTNWNTDAPGFQEWQDPLYKSFPFFIGLRKGADGRRRAYGILLDNSHRSEFDFGGETLDGVSFGAHGGELVYYFIFGPEPADVLRRYTEITGRAPLPPLWALGYQQSRWSYFPDTEVRTLVRQFRERRIPLDVVYLDIHYMDAYRVFTWHPERFPDPAGFVSDLREQGAKTVVIIDPGVKRDEGYFAYEEGLEQGHFVRLPGDGGGPDGEVYTGAVWPGQCHFPDFTRPATREWFGDLYRRMLDVGVAGIWTDMNEPSNHRYRTIPDLAYHDFEGEGGTHAEAHNVYGHLMARATYEGLRRHAPDRRPFVLTRAAFSGSQRYTACWTGDNVSNWEHLRLVLPMLLSLGVSGMPFAGSDVGGFFESPSPELFARWIQIGAFSPFFRTHTIYESRRQEPWSYGPAVETVARKFIELRYRLLPVFYTLFDEHRRTGLPILRPLFLHHPQDLHVLSLDDQFLLGENVLIAPILYEGRQARKVYLPKGIWYDFWNGRAHEGNTREHAEQILSSGLLEEMPIYVKAGTVLPLAPVQQYVGEQEIDELDLRIYPGEGVSYLYEDDGESNRYEEGHFRRTTFILAPSAGGYTLRRTSEGPYPSPLCRFRIIVFGLESAARLSIDGTDVPIAQEEAASEDKAAFRPDFGTLAFIAPADFEHIELGAV